MAAPLALTLDPALTVLTVRMTVRPDRALRRTPGLAGVHGVEVILQHHGERVELGELSPEELGLPSTSSPNPASPAEERPIQLRENLVRRLQDRLTQREDPGAPLWLEFHHPVGTLPLVPWERLLREAAVPVFRLAYHPVAPACTWGTQQLVLCISAAPPQIMEEAGALAATLIDSLANPPSERTLHLFADARMLDLLQDRVTTLATADVQIYDPARAGEVFENDAPATLPGVRSRWLQWIGRELGDVGIDGVHLLCRTHRSMQHGMVLFSANPGDPDSGLDLDAPVGPQELARFLTLLGAWSVGLADPVDGGPPLPLRLLADQVARSRVGTVLLHGRGIPSSTAIPSHLDFLYAGTPLPLPPPTDDTDPPVLYCHPTFARDCRSTPVPEAVPAFPQSPPVSLHAAPGSIDHMPAWQLSVKRSLERSTADLLEIRGDADENPAHQGVTRALEFIARLVESKSEATLDPEET